MHVPRGLSSTRHHQLGIANFEQDGKELSIREILRAVFSLLAVLSRLVVTD